MNPAISQIPPSLIRAINARKRPGDIDMGMGEPTLRPDMQPFSTALRWTQENGSPYSPNAGFGELRDAIANYLAGFGWASPDLTGESVCVTVGSEEALYLAIKTVVDPARDEVLVVEPCYLAYPKICALEGIRHRVVGLSPADGFQPKADAILEAVRSDTRLIVINTPSNPTGRVWPTEELAGLANGLTRDFPKAYVLTDEVYREIYFGEGATPTIARYHQQTLVAGSLSKSSALTGLRLGWLAGPNEVIANAVKAHQFVNTAASTFSQRVGLEVFNDPYRLSEHRAHYATTRERLLVAAANYGIDLIPPEGTFYGFIPLPPSLAGDSVAAAESLLEQSRVVTIPGRAFGESGEGWLRISWVAPPETVEEGLRRIAEWQAQ